MLRAEHHRFRSYPEVQAAYLERGWTDGLPIIPPTPEAVEEFLAYAGLAPDEVLGKVPTREVTVTAEHVAINAVMAGCKTEYMPVVVAAVRALLEEKANCHATTGTLSGAAHAVIVNGPIRNALDINCKAGCFGPGWQANAAIGRTLRLVVRNVCKAIPGYLDRASFSTPARYSFCFGENEEDSPWKPLHVELGFPPETSTVTVHSVTYMSAARDTVSREPTGILHSVARAARRWGMYGDEWVGENASLVIVIGPEHMRYFAEAGWPKKMMREYLFPLLVAPSSEREIGLSLHKPEGILFVAAGGPGSCDAWILHPHLAWAITKPIEAQRR